MLKKKSSCKYKIFGGWTLGFILFASVLSVYAIEEPSKIYQLNLTAVGENCGASSGGNVDDKFCGSVVNEQIYCKVKQTTNVIDSNGVIVGTEESGFLSGNPVTTFELTDEKSQTDLTKGGFLVTAKIKCASDANAITNDVFDEKNIGNIFGIITPSVEIPMKIKDGSLLVKVYSKDESGIEHETFNANMNFDELTLTNAEEKNLGELNIGSDRILVFIPVGEYDSFQRITVSGDIDIVWRDFNFGGNRITVQEEDIQTFREIKVTKIQEPEEIKCAVGQVKENNICVDILDEKPDDPEDEPKPKTLSTIEELMLCAQTFNTSCFLQEKFYPYWIAGFGSLFLLGAVTHNSAPKFDQFGNRIG